MLFSIFHLKIKKYFANSISIILATSLYRVYGILFIFIVMIWEGSRSRGFYTEADYHHLHTDQASLRPSRALGVLVVESGVYLYIQMWISIFQLTGISWNWPGCCLSVSFPASFGICSWAICRRHPWGSSVFIVWMLISKKSELKPGKLF